jgi:hypothetical protein
MSVASTTKIPPARQISESPSRNLYRCEHILDTFKTNVRWTYLLNIYLKDDAFANALSVIYATVRCVDGTKLTRRVV